MGPDRVAKCVGTVLSATLWTANIGLLVSAATFDCRIGERLEQISVEQDPFRRRLHETSDGDPATRQAFLRMVAARERALQTPRAPAQPAGQTPAQTAIAFQGFLRRQREDLQALCARDVFELFSSAATVAMLLQDATLACEGEAKFNWRCGRNVAAVVNRFTRASRFASEMQTKCPKTTGNFGQPEPSVSFGCGDRLEGVAWQLGPIGTNAGSAAVGCEVAERPPEWPVDYASCATQIASAVAYLGSTSLSIAAASRDDCVGLTSEDVAWAWNTLNGNATAVRAVLKEEKRQLQLQCARDLISSTRTLGLAAQRTSLAVGSCGGKKTLCGQDIAFAATALSAVAEASVLVVTKCRILATRTNRLNCAKLVSSTFKEMNVVAVMAFDASASCGNTTFASDVCGSSIARALAALAFLAERSSTAARNCPAGLATRTSCGINLEQNGQALQVASVAIGQAALNCGLGFAEERRTAPPRLPRRFFVPG